MLLCHRKEVCLFKSFFSPTLFLALYSFSLLLLLFTYLDDVTRTVHDPWARSENNYFATCKKSMRISITACDQELAVPMQVNNLLT